MKPTKSPHSPAADPCKAAKGADPVTCTERENEFPKDRVSITRYLEERDLNMENLEILHLEMENPDSRKPRDRKVIERGNQIYKDEGFSPKMDSNRLLSSVVI